MKALFAGSRLFKLIRTYSCPKWYDLFLTCHTHGWINLSPFSWDEKQNRLDFALLVDIQAVDVSVKQTHRSIKAIISSEKHLRTESSNNLDRAISRILGLKEDTTELARIASKINTPYRRLIKKGAGRLLRGASLWEDAAKTLFTTNCSWTLTRRMCEKICSANFSIPSLSGRYPFPRPSALANNSLNDLRKKIPIGYRSEYLKLLAQSFSKDSGLDGLEDNGASCEEAYRSVSRLKGFGPYARTHLLILAGYYERIPIDSEVTSYIKKNHKCRNIERFVNRHYAAWGKYKWWGLKFEKMLKRQNWLGD